ncbi:hypothetical protein SAMN06296273_1801 [Nitrosomonas ureae]|uniref:Uncharacterized protein n=1 Tax=Nitrosomonas ureae TaxID=44577 RepID=A0A285BYQ1_9PROT|nr:hypothetical protein SAMN06296273_1801 [Nitrosomonas ureae]
MRREQKNVDAAYNEYVKKHFYEQRRIVTKCGLLEMPLILYLRMRADPVKWHAINYNLSGMFVN